MSWKSYHGHCHESALLSVIVDYERIISVIYMVVLMLRYCMT